jgi:hypothetical protein
VKFKNVGEAVIVTAGAGAAHITPGTMQPGTMQRKGKSILLTPSLSAKPERI